MVNGAAFKLIKVNLQQQLAYRDEIVNQWLQMIVQVVISRCLWIALYQGREVVAGVTLAQALTYTVINIVVARLFSSWMIIDINDQIRSGDIVFALNKPMYFGHVQLYLAAGEALGILLTASLPMALVLHLIFHFTLPASGWVWLIFGVSLILGFLTSFFIDYMIALSAFWLTEVGGFYWAKGSIIAVLGGTYLPLWIYPPALARVLDWLPFRGISYTPLAIFVGQIEPSDLPLAFGVQIAWVILLAWGSRWLYQAAARKLAVQGG
ncbi:MAG: hypothetical protein JXA33_23155 [Anaerolineae bacterium]|nr:hypothetical protein [Anaerolineae bacterium]